MDINLKYIEFKTEELSLYKKKPVDIYFIESLDVVNEGEKILIPTLEGDVMVDASPNQYIMIGPCNDIYPITKELFESKYTVIENDSHIEVNKFVESVGWSSRGIKRCRLLRESFIYAKKVPFDFAVFVKQCNSVIYGKTGDYYVATYEDPENRYVISNHVMKETYELLK